MPLHVPLAPAPAQRSVLTALGSPTAVREAPTPALRAATEQHPATAEYPLPVHVLDRVTLSGRTPTRITSWRFLIRCGGQTVAAADTMLTPDGWAFSRFFEGPYVAATEQALQQAESLPAPYQPRLLSVPELYMLTLWLHGDITADGDTGHPAPSDMLVPLAPAPPGIAAHRPHRFGELLPVLTQRLAAPPLLGSPA
ncbi:hypothetical protein [Streptomyces odontomachi]|uniref:hypothetical protein n=1 Tax=Streptomyces odontomachi TaxID=2944940 RepID=UPI00210BBD09|nr:hypothetical protein [Streptomyces sp. ODS25]